MNLRVVRFRNQHQPMVDALLVEISGEFANPITSNASVQMKAVAHIIGNQFWVAMDGKQLVGTIGVVGVKNTYAVVKSMFVTPAYRGRGTSGLLMAKLISYCKKKSIQHIYLGTMSQMLAAQKFYEKNGFTQINRQNLPTDFGMNPLDDVFYKLKL